MQEAARGGRGAASMQDAVEDAEAATGPLHRRFLHWRCGSQAGGPARAGGRAAQAAQTNKDE